jgi:hypothetical protein
MSGPSDTAESNRSADAPSKEKQDPQVAMRDKVRWLLAHYVERDASEELSDIADYLSFLAERINTDELSIDADPDLIRCFESVHLLLTDRLALYPDTIQKQVAAVSTDLRLCDTMALLGSLSAREIWELRHGRLADSPGLTGAILRTLSIFSRRRASDSAASDPLINHAQFLRMKVAVSRIASIVRYASTLRMADYDESASRFRGNYDPELVDKNKLFALINILRIEINQCPESAERGTIIERLEAVERELHRRKIRWGIVITGFFMLFGFLADLKTLSPGTYTRAYQTLNTILNTIHHDGTVNKQSARLLGVERHGKDGHEDRSAGCRESALPPRRDDEDEVVS